MCPLSQPHTIGVHQRPQLAADSVRASDVAAAEAVRGDAGGVAAAAIRRLQPGYGGSETGVNLTSRLEMEWKWIQHDPT